MNTRKFLFNTALKINQFFAATKILKRADISGDIIFMPGCSLTSYNPEYIFLTRDYLRGKLGDCGIITACCSKPLKLIGDSKTFQLRIENLINELDNMKAHTVITACQNCYNVMKLYDKNRKILSLWPLMQKFGLPESLKNKYSGLEASIQDSCVSNHEIIKSVRELLKFLGVNIKEFSQIKCCGGVKSLTTGNIKLSREYMRQRANESPSQVIISYCASCRSAMSLDKKYKSIHLLDLIFGNGQPSKSNFFNRFIAAKNLNRR